MDLYDSATIIPLDPSQQRFLREGKQGMLYRAAREESGELTARESLSTPCGVETSKLR